MSSKKPKSQDSPSAEQVRKARERAQLTQTKAAELIYVTRSTWARYESGDMIMPSSSWELWRIKTGATATAG